MQLQAASQWSGQHGWVLAFFNIFSNECRRILEYRGRKAEIVCVCPQQDGWVRRLSQLCTSERPDPESCSRAPWSPSQGDLYPFSPASGVTQKGPLRASVLRSLSIKARPASTLPQLLNHILCTVEQTHAEWVWANLEVWPTGRNTRLAS